MKKREDGYNLPASQADREASGKKKMRTAIITGVVFLVVIAIFIGVIAVMQFSERRAQEKAVGSCAGFDIPYEELRFVTLYYKDALENKYGEGIWDDTDIAEQYREELEASVVENLTSNYAVLKICDSYNIDPDGDDVDEYVDTTISELIKNDFEGDKNKYKEWLAENNMTEHLLRFTVKISYLESAIYYMMADSGVLIPYTKENIDEFIDYVMNDKEYARTLHVYIENRDGDDSEANLRKAQEISDTLRAIENVEDRVEKMYEYIGSTVNNDYKLTTKDGYYFTAGEMDEVYEEHTFALELGEVSEAFACTDGYYVVMRVQPQMEYIAMNVSTLLQNYQSAQLGKLIQVYRDNYPASLNEYGESLDLVAME